VRAETRVSIAGQPHDGSWSKHLRNKIFHHLGLLSPVSAGIARTVRKILQQPEIAFGPPLVALLFLFTQHLIDGRDPKLMLAQRTERDLQATFAGYAHSDETE
jgi:hypothetical protein